ncbi:uncharacterized protein NDAI_0B04140 [Naumovozyma dairenensis CBS 421]|uniref:Uncharacterized protein n=1 Tax=Naumovozyma dairenensis (strain ATCC 10597 / BCRC 20456 / CBS 421 / NBRC 0211 / NRRL Y-12639) TaxID=1071378 RepID=G0W6N7_NAUDC|nr:hypothetical protein NDAI_0B04140 [Naumovozyma dairenensis CBS 421]CCD23448.1 hypothetical protein NDAI_0B04140 [Naumovozyma dairenensis CBS 421]
MDSVITFQGLKIDVPSFVLGTFITILGSLLLPILQQLIGEILINVLILIKYALFFGGMVFIFNYFVLRKQTLSPKEDHVHVTDKKQDDDVHLRSFEPAKVTELKVTDINEKEENYEGTVGSFRYFEIPITKLDDKVNGDDKYDKSSIGPDLNPITFTTRGAAVLNKSARYENFVKRADR